MTKDLIDIIKEEVMKNIIKATKAEGGDELSKFKLNVMEIKDILYSTLLDIEINRIKKKYGRE